jgi:hypothetical protein
MRGSAFFLINRFHYLKDIWILLEGLLTLFLNSGEFNKVL